VLISSNPKIVISLAAFISSNHSNAQKIPTIVKALSVLGRLENTRKLMNRREFEVVGLLSTQVVRSIKDAKSSFKRCVRRLSGWIVNEWINS